MLEQICLFFIPKVAAPSDTTALVIAFGHNQCLCNQVRTYMHAQLVIPCHGSGYTLFGEIFGV